MNWTGLLNWSLKQHQEDVDTTKIQAMNNEDKEWMRELMKEYEVNIVEEIKKSMEYIEEL
jgi:hypothetical protein